MVALCIPNFQYGWQLEHQGDLEKVRRAVERDPGIVNSYPDGKTPLYYAALHGRLEIVKYLVEHGAIVPARSENGLTAEEAARRAGHHETALYLRSAAEGSAGVPKQLPETDSGR